MIVQCPECRKYFEDHSRSYVCPHATFPANDGKNNFTVHNDAYLSDEPTSKQKELERHGLRLPGSECHPNIDGGD